MWAARERNPWLGCVLDAVGAELGQPVPPPGVHGPFALSDPDGLRAVLADFARVHVREFDVPMRASSFDEWWSRTTALAGPLARLLASLAADVGDSIRARAREAVRPYETSAGLPFPGVTLVATGERAA